MQIPHHIFDTMPLLTTLSDFPLILNLSLSFYLPFPYFIYRFLVSNIDTYHVKEDLYHDAKNHGDIDQK